MDAGDRGERRGGSGRNRRIALLVQYRGTCFNGWQMQKGGRTVQQTVENALEIITKERHRIVASGRTDSGVHALGQVVHMDTDRDIPLEKLCYSLNGILERDVSIKNAYNVNHEFHARYDAVEREYIYLIYNHPQRNPFLEERALWVNYPLDVDYLKEASGYLLGEKDFSSFCKKISMEGNMVRRIINISLHRKDDLISFRIRGNAFLHNMIRIIIGTLLEMYRENREPGFMQEVLVRKDRDCSGITAPACGLYLSEVIYHPPLNSYESAF